MAVQAGERKGECRAVPAAAEPGLVVGQCSHPNAVKLMLSGCYRTAVERRDIAERQVRGAAGKLPERLYNHECRQLMW